MVLDQLPNAHFYSGIAKRMTDAFAFFNRTDLTSLPIGKHPIAGEELFAMVQEYETKRPESVKWEAHRRYIDVQYLVSGSERMGHGFIENLEIIKEYDPDGDYLLLEGNGNEFVLRAGMFAIFLPHDAHRPTLAAHEPEAVRKIVLKVLVD